MIKKTKIIILSTILISFIIGIYFYPKMPEKMVSHWGIEGQPNGYMSKFWGLFLMPIISVAIFLLFVFIPKIDPLKANIEKFRKYYDGFILVVILFFLYIYMLAILWNIGARFSIVKFLVPAFAVLLYYCGILIENSKKNWFIGIRTPWTLSNEKVWKKTHQLGGKLFKIAGVIAFLGIFFQRYAFFFVIIPLIFVIIYTVIYSYLEYKKEIKNPRPKGQDIF